MASDASFAQFVADQVSGAGTITTRFMFGEYALYCNEKVVGLICDNKLFVKPTSGGRAFIGTPVEAPAYTGAKPSFLIEDELENRAWMTELIRITEAEVALPVKKTAKKAATRPQQKQTKKSASNGGQSVKKAVKKAAPRQAKTSTGKARKSMKKAGKKPSKRTVKSGKRAGRK